MIVGLGRTLRGEYLLLRVVSRAVSKLILLRAILIGVGANRFASLVADLNFDLLLLPLFHSALSENTDEPESPPRNQIVAHEESIVHRETIS